MGQFEDMTMFVRIVEAGGISKAAEQLDIAKSAVSRRLGDLEKRLATQLLSRTTRKSHLTESGTQYYQQAKNILEEVDKLNEQTRGKEARIDGRLKLAAPLSFGLMHLSQMVEQFASSHGELEFQIDFSDRHVDLIEEGYELAIRIGKLPDSSFMAKRITPIRHVLCASPEYLRQFGVPEKPADLRDHAFLQYGMYSDTVIELMDQQGQIQRIEVQSKMKANNGDFLKRMAIKGHGITYLPTFLTYQELASGKLQPLLTDFQLPIMHAYALYPKNRFLSQRCRMFIDFISEQLGSNPYWDQTF